MKHNSIDNFLHSPKVCDLGHSFTLNLHLDFRNNLLHRTMVCILFEGTSVNMDPHKFKGRLFLQLTADPYALMITQVKNIFCHIHNIITSKKNKSGKIKFYSCIDSNACSKKCTR